MLFRHRPDGVLADRVPLVRRFMPFVMRRRNEAMVWFEQDIEVDRALAFVDSFREKHGVPVTFFHLILRALARVLDQHPRLNRYVVGRRIYQRTNIALSFSGKEAFDDDSPMYVRKRVFNPREPLVEMVRDIQGTVRDGRAGSKTATDSEVSFLLRLPRPAVEAAVWGGRLLDYFNLLPAKMILDDPLYASVFIANLGSVGISAAYHHLFEHGTIPIFVVVGAYRNVPVATEDGHVEARRVSTLKYTYDERIEDGFYCARAIKRMKELLEEPERLI